MTKKGSSSWSKLAHEATMTPKEAMLEVAKDKKSLFIGVPNEIALQENRISLTPEAVAVLVNNGHEVWVEAGAGESSKFPDQYYSDAGAKIVYSTKEVFTADIVLKIEPPTLEELDYFNTGGVLFSAVQMGSQTAEYFKKLNSKKLIALGFEFLEDKVGGMPIVRAMSEIAGSTVMLIAGEYLSSIRKGQGVLLGGITGVPPTKVVILGAGTVAEFAARAALGLGAQIEVYDNHVYKLRRIKHLLGQQIYTSSIDTVTLGESLETADVVIAATRPERGRTRMIVMEEMVANMKQDSIIIDVSIDQGGCFETSEITTHDNPVFRKYGVIHYCVPNIASRVAKTASTAFSNIMTPILLRIGEEGGTEDMIYAHHSFMKGIYAYKGSLTNKQIAQKFGMSHKDLQLIMAARF